MENTKLQITRCLATTTHLFKSKSILFTADHTNEYGPFHKRSTRTSNHQDSYIRDVAAATRNKYSLKFLYFSKQWHPQIFCCHHRSPFVILRHILKNVKAKSYTQMGHIRRFFYQMVANCVHVTSASLFTLLSVK